MKWNFPIDIKYRVTQPWCAFNDVYSSKTHMGCDWGVQGAKNVTEVFVCDAEILEVLNGNKFLGNAIFYYNAEVDRTFASFHHRDLLRFEPGDVVKSGDILGVVGKTGLSFGEHVHLEVLKGRVTQAPRVPMIRTKALIKENTEDAYEFLKKQISPAHICPSCNLPHNS